MVRHFGLRDNAKVSDVKNEFNLTKYGLHGAYINQNTNFEKQFNKSKLEPTKQSVQSKTDMTDINYLYDLLVIQKTLIEDLIPICTQNRACSVHSGK